MSHVTAGSAHGDSIWCFQESRDRGNYSPEAKSAVSIQAPAPDNSSHSAAPGEQMGNNPPCSQC